MIYSNGKPQVKNAHRNPTFLLDFLVSITFPINVKTLDVLKFPPKRIQMFLILHQN